MTLFFVAFKQIKKNKCKPGIDEITIADFESRLDEELSQLQEEFTNWTYQPSPARRVEIPSRETKVLTHQLEMDINTATGKSRWHL